MAAKLTPTYPTPTIEILVPAKKHGKMGIADTECTLTRDQYLAWRDKADKR